MKFITKTYDGLCGPDEFWLETSKYSIKINLHWVWTATANHLHDSFSLSISDGSKYTKRKVQSLSIFDKKDKKTTIEIDLACKILPHIEDLVDHPNWFSDKLINQKIDRLLKLKVFL
jgi:hypothetical protein